MNFKDEFMETMIVFFDIIVLNLFFYLITLTSFSLFLIPTLFIFANLLYRFYRKNTKSILADLKDILKRDFYLILKHNTIQWLIIVFVVLFINNITNTIIFITLIMPYLIIFWYLFINRTLGFFEYYKVSFVIILGYPLLYLLMLLAILITSYVVFFMNGFFLIVFLPIGLIFILLFLVDKKVLELEKKNEKS